MVIKRDAPTEAELEKCHVFGFEVGERRTEAKELKWHLEAGRAARRNAPCCHLDFSPVTSMSDLYNYKIID